MHRWEDFSYNYLFYNLFFCRHPIQCCVFFPVGLSSLCDISNRRQKKLKQPTRPVENVILTTKDLQERKHNIEWDDGRKIGYKINNYN